MIYSEADNGYKHVFVFLCVWRVVLFKDAEASSLSINLFPPCYPHNYDLGDLSRINAAIKVTRLWKYRLAPNVTEELLGL